MEKFSSFRDRGTQIAPFLPIHGPRTNWEKTYGFIIFLLRLPFFISVVGSYLFVIHWLPVGSLVRKAWLWSILGVCGVWWVDLQVEGVRRGTLARQAKAKLPGPGSIIVSSYTSPLDAIYLAAIFDPIFTTSYPTTKLVEHVSLPVFLWRYFTPPCLRPAEPSDLISIPDLLKKKPNRTILLFPEATPTNGRGILRFTPALSTAPPKTKIFPISLKYSPADITTPVPNAYMKFLWSLLSRPTHCIRVRIAETMFNNENIARTKSVEYDSSSDTMVEEQGGICERGSEALARIGRIKRLNLGVQEKIGFVQAWQRRNRVMG
ncbi:hypothetical protein BZA77DRAFT_310985 [Pyronema omphalodes]|nr:hypothetical protein BZA77DRAFT_310985 [Pyronema omphalodes]